MTTVTDSLLCDGSCSEFRYYDEEWSIWICSLCDRPLAASAT